MNVSDSPLPTFFLWPRSKIGLFDQTNVPFLRWLRYLSYLTSLNHAGNEGLVMIVEMSVSNVEKSQLPGHGSIFIIRRQSLTKAITSSHRILALLGVRVSRSRFRKITGPYLFLLKAENKKTMLNPS